MSTETPSNRRHGRASTFGEQLRRLREAAGLTQEELASRAGLTAKAVGALERGERKRPYPHTVRSLADTLGLPEDGRAALTGAVPARSVEEEEAPAVLQSVIPALYTSLVGRERELEEIRRFLLGGARLLTLTGTGGVGKTSLALQAAREDGDLFPDGVAFVGLAPLADASLVVPTISPRADPSVLSSLSGTRDTGFRPWRLTRPPISVRVGLRARPLIRRRRRRPGRLPRQRGLG